MESYVDEMGVSVISPSGRQAGPFYEFLGAQRYILGDTELLIYYGEPKPYSVKTGDLSVASSRKNSI